jgi:hypothetical protein
MESGPSVSLHLLGLVRTGTTWSARSTHEMADADIISTPKSFLIVATQRTRNVRVAVFIPIVYIPAAVVLKVPLCAVDAIAKATLLDIPELTWRSIPSTGSGSARAILITGAILIAVTRRSVLGLRHATRPNCHSYCEGPCCDLQLRCHPFPPFGTSLHTNS